MKDKTKPDRGEKLLIKKQKIEKSMKVISIFTAAAVTVIIALLFGKMFTNLYRQKKAAETSIEGTGLNGYWYMDDTSCMYLEENGVKGNYTSYVKINSGSDNYMINTQTSFVASDTEIYLGIMTSGEPVVFKFDLSKDKNTLILTDPKNKSSTFKRGPAPTVVKGSTETGTSD